MNTQTFLLILLAALAALGIVLFQYYFKTKSRGKLILLLAFLRFLAFFGAFLLLINPKFTKNEYRTEKSNLVVLVDNSSSVEAYKEDITDVLKGLRENEELDKRFNFEAYGFGSSLNALDSLNLNEKITDVSGALDGLKEIYSGTNSAVILISDGNQTIGRDYEFYGKSDAFPIYPIAIGDTTRYEDIAIAQVNVNQYAFLKNKYPIELTITYSGSNSIKSAAKISVNGKSVFRQVISLSGTNRSTTINTLLDANSIGLKNIEISVDKLNNERNINNNRREVAIEVIDEKTNIAIVSNLLHPDIGALKKAIESNEQRSVVIVKPDGDTKEWDDIDLFILYQPNPLFKTVYEYIQQRKANVFTITGTQTNWNFLNNAQNVFSKKSSSLGEEVTPIINQGFTLFNGTDFSIQDFPPLQTDLGEITLREENQILLNQQIKGAVLNEPLLAIFSNETQRQAALFGENIWKWRVQSYRNDGDFKNFDDFIGKLILYLATNKSRERLSLDYESVYNASNGAIISATYFDNTFVFDSNATIILKLQDLGSKKITEMPMLLKGSYFQSDLSSLPAGKYNFTASVKNENLTKSGSFTILDFDVEKQLLSTDYQKLNRLAQNTGGNLFYAAQTSDLVAELLEDGRFVPTQKSNENVVSLIDFRILLAVIALALTVEWFLRKYNGLI